MSRLSNFIDELRRRRVFRVAAFYGGIAFVIVQIIDGTFDVMGIPAWVSRLLIILMALGFPVSMILAWVFDITPEGIVRTARIDSGGDYPQVERKSQPLIGNRALGLIAVVAIAFGIWGRWGGDGALFVSTLRGGNPIPIAVIDFTNETGEPALDGLSGMLITSLEQSSNLAVLTRSGLVDAVKRLGHKDVEHIGEELGKKVALENNLEVLIIASVRKFGENYTIDIKGLSPLEERYIFTGKDEGRGQESIPGMLDNLAKLARSELKERTSIIAQTDRSVADLTTSNLDAYQFYFEGMEAYHQWDFESANESLNKALEIDSTFALAYLGLAIVRDWAYDKSDSLLVRYISEANDRIDRLPDRERYLLRATALPDTSELEAIIIYEEALTRFPDNKEMLFQTGDNYFHLRRFAEARIFFENAARLDPLYYTNSSHLQELYLSLLPPSQAIEQIKIISEPYYSNSQWLYGIHDAYIQADSVAAGIAYFENLIDRFPAKREYLLGIIAMLSAAEGQPEIATRILAETSNNGMDNVIASALLGMYRSALSAAHTLDLESIAAPLDFTLSYYGYGDTAGAESLANTQKSTYYESATIYPLMRIALESDLPVNSRNNILAGAKAYKAWHDRPAERAYIRALSGTTCPTPIEIASVRYKNRNFEAELMIALAECEIRNENWAKAETWLEKFRRISNLFGLANMIHQPRSLYFMGLVNEKQNRPDEALRYYEELLDLWQNADEDLILLIETKERYAALKAQMGIS